MSKCHIVGYLMHWLNYPIIWRPDKRYAAWTFSGKPEITCISHDSKDTYRFIRLGHVVGTHNRTSKQADVEAVVVLCASRCEQWTSFQELCAEK